MNKIHHTEWSAEDWLEALHEGVSSWFATKFDKEKADELALKLIIKTNPLYFQCLDEFNAIFIVEDNSLFHRKDKNNERLLVKYIENYLGIYVEMINYPVEFMPATFKRFRISL